MNQLVLINGAPGSGKSTMATAVAVDYELMLALDVDGLKHSLSRWEEDLSVSGLHARRLALALAREHLIAGYDVVLGQYLARTAFIEELEELAIQLDAQFIEFVLDINPDALASRLRLRAESPSRPEHAVNNRLVRAADAAGLVESIQGLRRARPHAIWVEASGAQASTLKRIRAGLAPLTHRCEAT
ncbi:MAG: AAA family ATPase [Arachnia sp.]